MSLWKGKASLARGLEAGLISGLVLAYALPQREAAQWTVKWMTLAAVLALMCAHGVYARMDAKRAARTGFGACVCVIACAFWLALSVGWSLDPGRGMLQGALIGWTAVLVLLGGGIGPRVFSTAVLTVAAVELAVGWWINSGMSDAMTGERVHGSFVNANHYAALLTIGFGVACARAAVSKGHKLFGWTVAGVIFLSAACLSGSRALFIAVPAVLAAVAWSTRGFRNARAPLLLAALSVLILSLPHGPGSRLAGQMAGKDAFSSRRIDIWMTGLRILRDSPLAGKGLGSFSDAFRSYRPRELARYETSYAHCEPLHLACETGLVGAGLLAWLGAWLFSLLSRFVRTQDPGAAVAPILAAVISFSLVDFPLRVPVIAACAVGSVLALTPCAAAPRRIRGPAWAAPRLLAAFVPLVPLLWVLCQGAADLHYIRGSALALEGSRAEAVAEFGKSLRLNDRHAGSLLALAELSRDREDAVRRYELARRMRPSWSAPLAGLFREALARGDAKEAAALLECARKADGEGLDVRLIEVDWIVRLGDLPEAEKRLSGIEETWPGHVDVLLARARLLGIQGKREDEVRLLRHILAAYPAHEAAREELRKLE